MRQCGRGKPFARLAEDGERPPPARALRRRDELRRDVELAPEQIARTRAERSQRGCSPSVGGWRQRAQLGEQYKSKKGASGDVKRADGPNPFAYLPLNPRMLGKRQQRNVKTTISKFVAPKGPAAKAARASSKGPQRKHGIEARRLKGKGDRKPHKAVR